MWTSRLAENQENRVRFPEAPPKDSNERKGKVRKVAECLLQLLAVQRVARPGGLAGPISLQARFDSVARYHLP